MDYLIPLRPLNPLSSNKPDELTERFEILGRPSANQYGYSSCVAREIKLGRRVQLHFFPPNEGSDGLEIAIAIGNLNLSTSTRIFDIVKQSNGTTVLISELVDAPVLSDWIRSASEGDIEEIREQTFEWAEFWNQNNDRKIRFEKDSIRVTRTSGGRPLCKICHVLDAENKADVFESLVGLFSQPSRKKAVHDCPPEVDDWFTSLFEKDSTSDETARFPANIAVAACTVALLGGLAAFLLTVF